MIHFFPLQHSINSLLIKSFRLVKEGASKNSDVLQSQKYFKNLSCENNYFSHQNAKIFII